jgi:hypothetical protein
MVPTRIWRASLVGLLIALWPTRAVPEVPQVDVALALAIDVSYSVDNYEHRLQMEGFASALQSSEVMEAIKRGKHQRIAVTIYQWSDENNQSVLVPWRVIATEQDAREVGEFLALGRRNVSEGGTAITASLYFAAGLFATAPAAERQVIDLATDGRNNMGRPVREARDAVTAQGITINGLAISNEWKQLSGYLENQVIGGPAAFVEEAGSYDDFGAAMLRKLLREIAGPGVT